LILVTGANGFIGRSLAEHLTHSGSKLRILTRGGSNNIPMLGREVDVWQGDLNFASSLSGIAESIETVYHLAGEFRNRKRFTSVNYHGTQNLLAQCQSSGVRRFLYLSSAGVVGARGEKVVVDEFHPAIPYSEYEISKYDGEQAALKQNNQRGMRVSIIRPTIVYGENFKNKNFLKWLRAIKKRRFFQLGRDFVSSYVYVGDVVAACLAVANDPRSGGEVYFVNEPIPLSIFIGELSKALGVDTPPEFPNFFGSVAKTVLKRTGRFSSLYNYTNYSMNKLTDLGFVLPFGYREGVHRTVKWYREKSLL